MNDEPGATHGKLSRRLLLSGLACTAALRQATGAFAMRKPGAYASLNTQATPTKICVRVIARDGKFLGDDVGGASIVIRDAETRELLAKGNTAGASGLNGPEGVMCASLRRGDPVPTTDASNYTAELQLDRPRRVEITAHGPLGIPRSSNTVTATQWIYPGKDITDGEGFLMEVPGLIVQLVSPAMSDRLEPLSALRIQAHVAMMCGCPIDYKSGMKAVCPELPADQQPWLPNEFEVAALVCGPRGVQIEIPMQFIADADEPGQFAGIWEQPLPGPHEVTVHAYQKATGNTGVDTATIAIPG